MKKMYVFWFLSLKKFIKGIKSFYGYRKRLIKERKKERMRKNVHAMQMRVFYRR